MAVIWKWPFNKLIKTIVATLLNKYDFFIAIEGVVGSGKSTLALQIAASTRREFNRLKKLNYDIVKYYYDILRLHEKGISEEDFIEELIELKKQKAYSFNFKNHLIYRREPLIKFLNNWKGIGVSDEAVNTMFNRDFINEEQKNILKLLNMNRDHNNLLIACIPRFKVLDNQVRDMCKMRLSVVRRGVAVIQTPNHTFYAKDKWDTYNNEKIEREWLTKKSKRPRYGRLTTCRGMLKFSKLSSKNEEKYHKIKNEKRTIIIKKEMGMDDKKKKKIEEKIYERLTKGGIKNMQIIEGVAIANNISLNALRGRVRKILVDKGENPLLSSYFYDKKAKKKGDFEVESIT